MAGQIERDTVTGRETTGHEWDGIKELNTPLPKWWLYVFYATIVWAIGYWIVYPAWPGLSGYTQGLLGYNSRAQLAAQVERATELRRPWVERLDAASLQEIGADPELLSWSMAGARPVFGDNCATCHGAGGQGAPGFPVLADDNWIWGGDLDSLFETIRVGIRSDHPESRIGAMPRFGADGLLQRDEIADVAEYVLSLSGRPVDAAAAARGAEIYDIQCAACHGAGGEGSRELGAPGLADDIWLFGGSKTAIMAQVGNPRHGVMPAWEGRLDEVTLKMLTIYVHSLGGGE